jgi:hypothetical protein
MLWCWLHILLAAPAAAYAAYALVLAAPSALSQGLSLAGSDFSFA